MIIAPLPFDEIERLKNLESYNILDTPAEDDFDNIVHLASLVCNTPLSLVSLLDKDRTWFKAKTGTDMECESRDVSFCSHAILQDDILVVNNALCDERFKGNPHVVPEEGIRFYAGVPIVSPEGYKLGTVCVADYKPRTLTDSQIAALKDLSLVATRLLELKRKNILLRKRAEEFIVLKSEAIRSYMAKNETAKQKIAQTLHEYTAQNIASALMLLQACMNKPEITKSSIEGVQRLLSETLKDVKSEAYKITPYMVAGLESAEMLRDYIQQLAPTYPFNIALKISDSPLQVDTDLMLSMMRITEQWLSVLSYHKQVSSVTIRFSSADNVHVSIHDNDEHALLTERERDIIRHLLLDGFQSMGGEVHLDRCNGENILMIAAPQAVAHPIAV
ncbi:MAG: GAF domain-containing protein [Agriterribacter sp.]